MAKPPRPVEIELGGDVAFLLGLRLFQRVVVMGEIGAGILPAHIQEQVVKPSGKIVMMGDVGTGGGHGIPLVKDPQGTPQEALHAMHAAGAGQGKIAH
jgi:hypothetical protein